jgi:hypothetical protein
MVTELYLNELVQAVIAARTPNPVGQSEQIVVVDQSL